MALLIIYESWFRFLLNKGDVVLCVAKSNTLPMGDSDMVKLKPWLLFITPCIKFR